MLLKSKLVRLFRQLNKNQRIALRKFLASPYHNLRQDLLALWQHLETLPNNQDADSWSKERAWQAIHGQQPYDDQQLRHLMSLLHDRIESFLITEALLSDQQACQIQLAKVYREWNDATTHQKIVAQGKQHLDRQPLRDGDYWYRLFQWELETYRLSEKEKRTAPRNLQQTNDLLDLRFMVDKLKQGCLMLAHQAVYKTTYNLGLLPVVLEYVEAHPDLCQHPALGLYFYYYRALTHSEPEQANQYYLRFREMLMSSTRLFLEDELRDLFILAINFGIRRINQSATPEALRQTLQLYQQGLEDKILLENGICSRFTFNNMIAIALRLRDFDWVRKAIDRYGSFLEETYRATYVHYALSKLHFTQGLYDQAMRLLQQIEYEELFLNLDTKIMLMKIYYLQKEFQTLDYFLNSFKAFLHRRKDELSYHFEIYQNILSFVRQLLQLNPFDRQAKEDLRQRIQTAKVLNEREWLLTQLDQI